MRKKLRYSVPHLIALDANVKEACYNGSGNSIVTSQNYCDGGVVRNVSGVSPKLCQGGQAAMVKEPCAFGSGNAFDEYHCQSGTNLNNELYDSNTCVGGTGVI